MPSARALIVDDSRTAQVRLKKLLRRYDLEVDTATSAEQALSYLTYQVPAVIFMDHMMAGMDGFEALRVIKSNPETATLPVVMYTSKSGDLYVGQARALGAVGVLSKEAMKPSSIEPMLADLKIRRLSDEEVDSEKAAPAKVETVAPVAAAVDPSYQPKPLPPSVDAVEGIRKQVAKSLEMNISSVRQEISDSSRVLSSRFVKELKEMRNQLQTLVEKPKPAVEPVEIVEPEPVSSSGMGFGTGLLLLLVLVSSGFSAYTLYGTNNEERELAKSVGELRQLVGEEYQRRKELDASAKPQFNGLDAGHLLNAIAWSFNQVGQVDFDRSALSAGQLSLFTGLSHHLNQAGFSGDIVVELRRGDFCVNFDESGAVTLAVEGTLQAECVLLSDYAEESAGEEWLSQGFIDFSNGSPVFASGDIRVVIQEEGFNDPYYQYPNTDAGSLADDWNEAAAMNNRVDIRILPE